MPGSLSTLCLFNLQLSHHFTVMCVLSNTVYHKSFEFNLTREILKINDFNSAMKVFVVLTKLEGYLA